MPPNRHLLLLFSTYLSSLHAQWSLHSDLYISGGNEMHIAFAETHFVAGKIITERSLEKGVVSFAKNSRWHIEEPNSYVDGVVRIYHNGDFDFPLGNTHLFIPIGVRNLSVDGYFQIAYSTTFDGFMIGQGSGMHPFSNHFWIWETPHNTGYGKFNLYWNIPHQLKALGNFNTVAQLQIEFFTTRHWQPIEAQLAPHPWAATTAISLYQGQLETLVPITFGQTNALTFLWDESSQWLPSSLQLPLISQVVTPNGDGINDSWKIEHILFDAQTTINLYNRFGQEVFRNVGPYSNHWQGVHFKNGNKLPAGAYYNILTNGTKKSKGWIYLKWN